MYCGTAAQAVHLQVTGSSCNVTTFDISALYTAVTNPTLPCERSIYNKTCTVFAGSLLIDISPAIDPQTGNFYKQQNPNVQARRRILLYVWKLLHGRGVIHAARENVCQAPWCMGIGALAEGCNVGSGM